MYSIDADLVRDRRKNNDMVQTQLQRMQILLSKGDLS